MRLYAVHMLYLLWGLVVLAGIYVYAARRRAVAIRRFADASLLERLNVTVSASVRVWKVIGTLAVLALIVLALSRPAWNPKPKTVHRQGRDVVFLVDVSKSMLADDLVPNRLERAKLAMGDCLEVLEGDRVGLVAFAGTAVVKCPLTLDYGFFRMMLSSLSPGEVSRGGTLIGDALRRALEDVFDDKDSKYRDVVLITDGEDHDSFPVEAAQEAGRRGVRLIAIGLGDETQGRRVPVVDESGRAAFLTYQGQEVWTKLDAATLREMASMTPDGQYLNVATGTFDLGQIYLDLIASARKRELEARTVTLYEEKFQVFLGVAILLLCIETMVSERKRNGKTMLPFFVVWLVLVAFPTNGYAASAKALVAEGNQNYTAEDYQGALDAYEKAAEAAPESPLPDYNRGAALYQLGEYENAKAAFQDAVLNSHASDRETELDAIGEYNLGNCAFREAEQHLAVDPQAALGLLEQSVEHYRNALTAQPEFESAAYNTEVARRAIQRILEQQQQQEQDRQEMQDKLDDLMEQQQEDLEQNRAQQPRTQEESEELADQQQETRENAESLSSEMDQKQPKPPETDQAKEHVDRAAEKQRSAEEHLRNQEPEKAESDQVEALDELKEAKDALDNQQEQQGQQKQGDPGDQEPEQGEAPEDQQQQAQPQDGQEGEEDANVPPPNETAENILDQEQVNKAYREVVQPGGYRPVDKDW